MTICSSCSTPVPSHTTFFGSSGEVCERCHTQDELNDRAILEEPVEVGFVQAGPMSFEDGGFRIDLGAVVRGLRADRPAGSLTSSDVFVYTLMASILCASLFGTFAGTGEGELHPIVVVGYLLHGLLFMTAAPHVLFNKRLHHLNTLGWMSVMLCFPTLGLFVYAYVEMIRGDRAARVLMGESAYPEVGLAV